MKPWKRIDDGTKGTKVGFRYITHKKFVMNNGNTMSADIVSKDSDTGAAVIALTPDNEVIVARQFRCGPERVFDELPGGMVDPGETVEQAALRELSEEVGYTSDHITYLGEAYVNAWENDAHHYFLAEQCYRINGSNPEPTEEIEVDTISIDQLIANAKGARMTDVQAILLAYDKLMQLKEES